MRKKKSKSVAARIAGALAIVVAVSLAIFLLGRYGWMLGGFRACQGAAIEAVEVTDLDGDGTEELAIGSMVEDEFFGKMIFSLYTLDGDGVPQLLFDSTERNRYYYAGGFRFANLGSSDWNDSFVTTLKLEDKELIDMTYTTDPADYVQMELTPFSQWVK